MKILVTGGAGFIGSHAAEFYASRGDTVIVLDNLSRARLLKRDAEFDYNWNYLKGIPNIKLVRGDIRDKTLVLDIVSSVDAIIHTAGQTAVTTSVTDPEEDFSVNVTGTFNILESARRSPKRPAIIFCSTNKVYGDRVNSIKIIEKGDHYSFAREFSNGISEDFGVDLCEHTPYGCSKLSADLYCQDYGLLYGLKVGIFRMSCIYGTRQFGVEDQGWVAWFAIAAILGKEITIFGDGKQVRDVLYVEDLIRLYDIFLQSDLRFGVFNTGGGKENVLSLLQLLEILKKEIGTEIRIKYDDWRPSDQKVYISDTTKAKKELGWVAKIPPEEGVRRLLKWIKSNKSVFEDM